MKIIDDLKQEYITKYDKSDLVILLFISLVLSYGCYMICCCVLCFT